MYAIMTAQFPAKKIIPHTPFPLPENLELSKPETVQGEIVWGAKCPSGKCPRVLSRENCLDG